jgi:general secretion pathway protein G
MEAQKKGKAQRGFTLMELMVVIVIMGVLASLVVPNLMGNKDRADRQKTAQRYCCSRKMRWICCQLDNHRYPTTEQAWRRLLPPCASSPG